MQALSISSRSALFWVLLTAISIGGIIFSYKFFPRAFAIVKLDISMSRQDALAAAKQAADTMHIGPVSYQQAAAFQTDSETKNFIELEGGGVSALENIIAEQWYTPYYWQVRHFEQYNPHEASFYFLPNGKPYGFQEKLSQYQKGAALPAGQAQKIAENQAQKNWHISFDSYQLAETANTTALSGRIDHTFIYERTDKKVEQSPYRLKLVVSGDKLTELSYSIKVPEAFTRRYENMRSTNRFIAFIATFLMALLYLGFGLIAGLIFLLHRHLLWWRPALAMGIFIALLQALNNFNEIPLDWMEYETALSKTSFLLTLLTSTISQFIIYTIILAAIFAVAEGLTRAAFPHHLLLWNAFRSRSASSLQVVGRTIGAYLIIGFDLAFVIGVYAFARTHFGWWNPSETLFNPNILATYVPWFSSIARSMMAGIMEESLFRALPLAGAALLAKRFGQYRLIMAIAFILQALIFGAAHATYPAQPAYARVLELIIPSLIFGMIYFVYGLIPAMLSHVLFDVFWFALPLFLASGMFVNKFAVIFVSLIPLWLIARSFLKERAFKEAPESAYNKSWINSEPIQKNDQHIDPHQHIAPRASSIIALGCFAALGCFVWIFTTRFTQDNVPLSISRKDALALSSQIAQQKGIPISATAWQQLPSVQGELEDEHDFVWQTTDKKQYISLLGNYLPAALWKIRFAQFEGDLEKRAEEYELYIDNTDQLVRLIHKLPESQPGASLSQQSARALVHNYVRTLFHVEPANLIEISAESIKHPARTDWHFTFKDPSIVLAQGEARLKINLLGDKLGDYERLVFVPESWERSNKEHEAYKSILSMICRFILIGALIAFGIALSRRWKYMHISLTVFIGIASIIGIKAFLNSFNIWPVVQASFQTSEPYQNQMITVVGWYVLMIVIQAISLGAGASLATALARKPELPLSLALRIFIASACSIILAAVRSLSEFFIPPSKPLTTDYSFASTYMPSFAFAASALTTFITTTIVFMIMARALNRFTQNRKHQTILLVIGFAILYSAYSGLQIDGIASWLVSSTAVGITFGILYATFIRSHYELFPWLCACSTFLFALRHISYNAYPGSFIGSIIAIIITNSIAFWWSKQLE